MYFNEIYYDTYSHYTPKNICCIQTPKFFSSVGDHARELAAVALDQAGDTVIPRHRQTVVYFAQAVKLNMNRAIRNRVHKKRLIFGRYNVQNLMVIRKVCLDYRPMLNGSRNMEFQVS